MNTNTIDRYYRLSAGILLIFAALFTEATNILGLISYFGIGVAMVLLITDFFLNKYSISEELLK